MVGLEIALNGKRKCVAGLPFGAVTATIGTTQRGRARRTESIRLTVSGYTETANAHVFPWWIGTGRTPRLRVGDVITVRIVDVARANKPRAWHRDSKRALEDSERRYYLKLKRRYEKRDAV